MQPNIYKEFAPPNAIAHLVGAFWSFSTPDSQVLSSELIQHRVLPDGCMDIIFQYERSPEPAALCGVAVECGYADQAHMGREFQQSGLTPTAFIS